MKKRADGRYMQTISIGYNDSGKVKRKCVYGHSISEVTNKIADIKSLYNKGLYSSNGNISLKDWTNKWFEIYKSNKSYNTKKEYNNAINNYIMPKLGDYKLKNLKQYNIQELINDIVEKGKYRTAQQVLLTIKQIISKAIEQDYIYKDITSGVTLQVSYKAKEKIPLTKEQRQIFETVAQSNRAGNFFMILLYTGMRREEIVPLTFDDIDLKNKKIIISKAVYFKSNQPQIKETKNTDSRIIPILDKIYPIFEKIFNSKNKYLFVKEDGNMLSETALRRMLESFLKDCNNYIDAINVNKKEKIPYMNFTFHTLRHTFCTIAYYAGVGIKETQEIMGHRESKMVMDVYTHLDKSQILNASEKLNKYI